jgi:hypothetical protein
VRTAPREPEPGILDEGLRLVSLAKEREVVLRMLGGAAIHLRLGSRLHPRFRRDLQDIDFVTAKGAGRQVSELLREEGYEANEGFNRTHGATRLLFYDTANERQVDVFVGSFRMCHELPLARRLMLDATTLPLAELVMTKMQIVRLNQKDLFDLYALLLAYEVEDHDADAINGSYIGSLCGRDWGLYRTFSLNLERLAGALPGLPVDAEERATIGRRIDALSSAIEEAPRSQRWRMRARVGDRVRWYEEPEEVEEGTGQ